MAMNHALLELEQRISELPLEDQLLLIQRVQSKVKVKPDLSAQLKDMAYDPEVQKELREIQAEFTVAEADGLDR